MDIGGGTTDIAVFVGGSIRHSAVIPVAGDQITNDIVMALRTPTADAEEIKLRHGLAKPTLANPGDSNFRKRVCLGWKSTLSTGW